MSTAQTAAIAEYSATEAALSQLKERLLGAKYEVTTTAGMDTAKKDRRELVTLRTDLEKERQRIKAPALECCRLIDAEAKRITAELLQLEQPIDQQIKAEEERKAAIKAEKERLERERVEGIQGRIEKIRALPLSAVNLPSAADLEIFIARVEAQQIGVEFAGFAPQAETAKVEAVEALRLMLEQKLYTEAEAARVKAEQEAEAARLEALRIEQEKAAAAERERLAAERAEQDRLRAIEEEKLKAEREELQRFREAELKRQREAEEKAAAARAEADRIAAEERAKQQAIIDAERAELRRQQEESERLERERQEKEATEQAERDRLAREKAEAEASEQRRIAAEKADAEYKAKMDAATADHMTTLRSILDACQDATLSAPAALMLIKELAKRGIERVS